MKLGLTSNMRTLLRFVTIAVLLGIQSGSVLYGGKMLPRVISLKDNLETGLEPTPVGEMFNTPKHLLKF